MRGARSNMDMEDLAQRMSVLEEQAFLEFANFFGPRFRSLFVKRGLTLTDAEELSVSCVTDIALKAAQYRSLKEGSFEAWVFTLARHYLIDWWRSRNVNESLSDDLTWITLSEESLEPNPELISAVHDAMELLSETDQTIIRLRNMEGEYTYAEAGKELDVTAGAARVRHLRALRRLQSILEADQRIQRHLTSRTSTNQEKSL